MAGPDQSDCWEITFLCSFTPSDPQLLPQTMRSPQPGRAHPQEVRGQAPSQPVHDVKEKEAADGVEELTWGRGGDRARLGPSSPLPFLPFTPLLCPLCFPTLTPLPRTGGAGHHGCDGGVDGQGDCEDQHKAQRRQPDLGAGGRRVSRRGTRPRPSCPNPGPTAGPLGPGSAGPQLTVTLSPWGEQGEY